MSNTTCAIPVVPEPAFTDPEVYLWATPVKDSIAQLVECGEFVHNELRSLATRVQTLEKSAYGMMYVNDAAIPQSTIGLTPSILTGFDTAGPSSGISVALNADSMILNYAGTYHLTGQCSFNGTNSITFNVHIYRNGSSTSIGFHRKMGATGDVGSASMTGLLSCVTGDVISMYAAADSDNKSMTLVDAQLNAVRI